MFRKLYTKLTEKFNKWLTDEHVSQEIRFFDFNRLKYEIKPGDVLLIEGQSRISSVIRTITQSAWTHAALYIGRLHDIENEDVRKMIREHLAVEDSTRLLIEDLLDRGTVITPLNFYRHHHIRICRPIGITPNDMELVIQYAINALGRPYNVRHILDLARFLLPWSILPRRWGSSLFTTSAGKNGICSSLIAEAFTSVQFPILPFLKPGSENNIELFHRNPYLFTPKDFDYSPFFDIIKYPLFSPDNPLPYYRRLPWTKDDRLYHDNGIITAPKKPGGKKKLNLFKKDTPPSNQTED